MNITIGEIVNIVAPYSYRSDLIMVGTMPYLRIYIHNRSGFCKSIIYVAQTKPNEYAYFEDSERDHLILTGNPEKIVITDAAYINVTANDEGYDIIYYHKTKSDFIAFLYDKLSKYKIIKFNPSYLSKDIAELKLKDEELIKAVYNSFKQNGCLGTTICDLVKCVYFNNREFTFMKVKHKDIEYIASKLSKIGIICKVRNDKITNIEFELIKEERNESDEGR
jgi:hypothetical protein